MNQFTIILKKCGLLIREIFFLLVRNGRQIELPKKKTKGNVLNTLFQFFIGIVEKLQGFEHGNFKMEQVIQNSCVRKGLMLFACLFFFLTSFEYSVNAGVKANEVCSSRIENTSCIARQPLSEAATYGEIILPPCRPFTIDYRSPSYFYYNIGCYNPGGIYLQNRCIRI